MAYEYTSALVAYRGGAPVEEIPTDFKSIQAELRQEGWQGLTNRMTGRCTPDMNPNEDALNRMTAIVDPRGKGGNQTAVKTINFFTRQSSR